MRKLSTLIIGIFLLAGCAGNPLFQWMQMTPMEKFIVFEKRYHTYYQEVDMWFEKGIFPEVAEERKQALVELKPILLSFGDYAELDIYRADLERDILRLLAKAGRRL